MIFVIYLLSNRVRCSRIVLRILMRRCDIENKKNYCSIIYGVVKVLTGMSVTLLEITLTSTILSTSIAVKHNRTEHKIYLWINNDILLIICLKPRKTETEHTQIC